MAATGVQTSRSPVPGGDDWAAQTADTIERVVDSVRSKTAAPLERLARVVVYGVLAAILGVAMAVLVAVALVRGLAIGFDNLVDADVWAAHLVTGGMFTLTGLFLWSKKTADRKA